MSVTVKRVLLVFLNLIALIYCKKSCDEVNTVIGEIDKGLTGLAQDDPVVIEALKNYYLDKPNDFPRNLKGPHTPQKLQVSVSGNNIFARKFINIVHHFSEYIYLDAIF